MCVGWRMALASGTRWRRRKARTATSSILSGSNAAAPDLLATLQLSPDDLALARRQKVCPITRMALGSMGELVRVEVEGEPVFLCCAACKSRVRALTEQRQP